MDTIFALSSGAPPAGIAVIRISGPAAGTVPQALGAERPSPRRVGLRKLFDPAGVLLDEALILWMPGPASVTGEDLIELHCHGGLAIVTRIRGVLAELPGLREAEPGEFTRRGFANGRIDLAEAEGLADLLSAETELQLRAAQAMAGGAVSRQIEKWRDSILALSAQVETALDFADEDDSPETGFDPGFEANALADEMEIWLARPRAEILREGFRVVLAGPPNVGKSTLFNALVEEEAAITTPIAGTTRDVLVRPVAIGGVPFSFVDTAGLHYGGDDEVERIGMERARGELARADMVLWLGVQGEGPEGAIEVATKIDRADGTVKPDAEFQLSAITGEGIARLREALLARAREKLPKPGQAALNQRQHQLLQNARQALVSISGTTDLLLIAENLRAARAALDSLTGRMSTEDMLDTLFGRFCIGK